MKMNMEDSAQDEATEGADDLSNAMLQQYLKTPGTFSDAQQRGSSVTFAKARTAIEAAKNAAISVADDSESPLRNEAAASKAKVSSETEHSESPVTKFRSSSAMLPQHIADVGLALNQSNFDTEEEQSDDFDVVVAKLDKLESIDDAGKVLETLLSTAGQQAQLEFNSWAYDSALFTQSELCSQFVYVAHVFVCSLGTAPQQVITWPMLALNVRYRWLLSRCGYIEAFDVSPGTAYRFANRIASGYNSDMPYVQPDCCHSNNRAESRQ